MRVQRWKTATVLADLNYGEKEPHNLVCPKKVKAGAEQSERGG